LIESSPSESVSGIGTVCARRRDSSWKSIKLGSILECRTGTGTGILRTVPPFGRGDGEAGFSELGGESGSSVAMARRIVDDRFGDEVVAKEEIRRR